MENKPIRLIQCLRARDKSLLEARIFPFEWAFKVTWRNGVGIKSKKSGRIARRFDVNINAKTGLDGMFVLPENTEADANEWARKMQDAHATIDAARDIYRDLASAQEKWLGEVAETAEPFTYDMLKDLIAAPISTEGGLA